MHPDPGFRPGRRRGISHRGRPGDQHRLRRDEPRCGGDRRGHVRRVRHERLRQAAGDDPTLQRTGGNRGGRCAAHPLRQRRKRHRRRHQHLVVQRDRLEGMRRHAHDGAGGCGRPGSDLRRGDLHPLRGQCRFRHGVDGGHESLQRLDDVRLRQAATTRARRKQPAAYCHRRPVGNGVCGQRPGQQRLAPFDAVVQRHRCGRLSECESRRHFRSRRCSRRRG